MEEINFRVWYKEEKEMIEKDRIDSIDFNYKCVDYDVVNAISFGEGNEGVLLGFTGYKDKNGKEIYEGDILKLPEEILEQHKEEYDVVKYEDAMFQIGGYLFSNTWINKCEVVGNMYQLSDLIKNKEKFNHERY